MVYAIVRMLIHARPGRFEKAAERVRVLTQRLTGSKVE
jgi:hypothetical protein